MSFWTCFWWSSAAVSVKERRHVSGNWSEQAEGGSKAYIWNRSRVQNVSILVTSTGFDAQDFPYWAGKLWDNHRSVGTPAIAFTFFLRYFTRKSMKRNDPFVSVLCPADHCAFSAWTSVHFCRQLHCSLSSVCHLSLVSNKACDNFVTIDYCCRLFIPGGQG